MSNKGEKNKKKILKIFRMKMMKVKNKIFKLMKKATMMMKIQMVISKNFFNVYFNNMYTKYISIKKINLYLYMYMCVQKEKLLYIKK